MRYRLETQHSIWDMLLDEGTEIGDGTKFPVPSDFVPSAAMTPLDDEAKERCKEVAKEKVNWARFPEDNISLQANIHPIQNPSIYRPEAPIIPPPQDHLTHPNSMKPGDVPKTLEEIAAENDKKMAIAANERAQELADAFPKPPGVSEGQGPRPKPTDAPGQGPAKRSR